LARSNRITANTLAPAAIAAIAVVTRGFIVAVHSITLGPLLASENGFVARSIRAR
jgi:hypothetical protein